MAATNASALPRAVLAAAIFALFLAASIGAGLLGATTHQATAADGPTSAGDIPSDYLQDYEGSAAHYELGADGWSYLAAIGKIETDHGRSTAPGVLSGQNSNGCCAGPMQINNDFGSGGATWAAFKRDGDDDGREDIYDPADAIATAANYLRARPALPRIGAPRSSRTTTPTGTSTRSFSRRTRTALRRRRRRPPKSPATMAGSL
jgi:hypothetical protein